MSYTLRNTLHCTLCLSITKFQLVYHRDVTSKVLAHHVVAVIETKIYTAYKTSGIHKTSAISEKL